MGLKTTGIFLKIRKTGVIVKKTKKLASFEIFAEYFSTEAIHRDLLLRTLGAPMYARELVPLPMCTG